MPEETSLPLIVGVHAVYEALASERRPIQRLHISRGSMPEKVRQILELARGRGIPVRRERRESLDRMTGRARHQGVVAVAGVQAYVPLERVLDAENPLFVVLDGVEDPHNLGAVVRTAETSGATAVVVTERRSAPLTAAVSRASAGALEHVPVVQVGNLAASLKTMKKRGIWVVGVDPAGDRPWTDFDYTVPVALLLGGEHRGLRRLVGELCDVRVRIPMQGRIESLNVSVAAGVVLFEALRQRLAAVPKL